MLGRAKIISKRGIPITVNTVPVNVWSDWFFVAVRADFIPDTFLKLFITHIMPVSQV